ncbi:uncharacterized protein LOC143276671 [Babylonia areolata]|uniref:uncharacterized protein LOC143276671 n=1 Tax=Babylonia areolata TaxID=304850 RepID=UPI003FD2EEE2
MEGRECYQRLPLLLLAIFLPSVAEGRQMCLSCQFQTAAKPVGPECVDSPWNWTMGNVRARCPFKCALQFTKDIEKEEFTFAYRGCTALGDTRKDGCVEASGVMDCYFTCVDRDYCNNWNAQDFVDSGLPSIHFPPLASLFLALVAVTAAGFFW